MLIYGNQLIETIIESMTHITSVLNLQLRDMLFYQACDLLSILSLELCNHFKACDTSAKDSL